MTKRRGRKKTTKRKWRIDLKLAGAAIILIFLSLLVFNKYYILNRIDASFNGPETRENQQNFVPQDVKDEIEKQEKLGLLTRIPTFKVPILMYHYVEYVQDKKDTIRISLNTIPPVLDEQIKTLKDAGFTFMTAGDLSDVLVGKKILPKKPVLLTFDDGYRDFYTDAYPILKKYNVKATQYVISGFLDQPNHLMTTQLQKIASDGLVEIGGHTESHMWLKDESLQDVTHQVTESKKSLEKLIHRKVISFAYPYGAFDQQAINAVNTAGYKTAVSTVPGIQQSTVNRFFLYRLRPGGRTGQELTDWLDSEYFSAF